MQINRCFEMVYLLLERGKMTAGQLAQHFEVSVRTIYRDVDTLSLAGIPVFCTKGKGGGIQLMEEFVMNKSLLSQKERNEILFGLQSLQAAKYPELDELHHKLSGLFGGESQKNWVEIDFGGWDPQNQKTFALLRRALMGSQKVEFDYFNSEGESSRRVVEPLKLTFKDHAWYLEAYCELRNDFRLFKISRIRHSKLLEQTFVPKEWPGLQVDAPPEQWVHVLFWIDRRFAFRVYDEFAEADIKRMETGDFLVSLDIPYEEWIFSYLSSYGPYIRVIEPKEIAQELVARCREIISLYE